MLSPSRPAPFILLASVLKPVDDTRMYEKFGRSLAEAGYRAAVAGRAAGAPSGANDGILQEPLFHGHRLGLARLRAQWHYWRLLRTTKPELVIAHAPELLPLTVLWHKLTGRPFFYDVRENYALNIRTQQVYRGLLRRVLAAGVAWMEQAAARRAAAVLLAERSYARELPWLPAGRTVVLENKYVPPAGAPAPPPAPVRLPAPAEPLRLLYSGTISELNGVFDAINLAARLHRHRGNVSLTVIGYCQRPDEQRRLDDLATEHADWLRVVGGAQPVPHAAILAEIRRSHLGLLPYRPHPSSWHCIPTKLYEYFANALPVLIPPNPLWQAEVEQHEAGAVVDFQRALPEVERVWAMSSPRHYPRGFYPHGPPADALWQSEAPRLLAAVQAALGPATAAETARPGASF
ncbi:glycosyltransferase [Hymenobacter sp. 15J16-1T3B]|uniref:glycosyltransferase n=1 Tax=Hymenobacter sp. 15J16-1T3B TaxID=2886941 RepID=UPI001D120F71|nr:glycosyltransferase [Hymenobacter sp. 15J16-1T3B]MCC3157114.1 glycosyltransferase [Hymenobacter sp. 15J16-1T3B]